MPCFLEARHTYYSTACTALHCKSTQYCHFRRITYIGRLNCLVSLSVGVPVKHDFYSIFRKLNSHLPEPPRPQVQLVLYCTVLYICILTTFASTNLLCIGVSSVFPKLRMRAEIPGSISSLRHADNLYSVCPSSQFNFR